MKFDFLNKNKKDNDSEFKNIKPHMSRSIKTEKQKNGYKRHSRRNDMPQSRSYSNSPESSKSNSCLLILIGYAIIGYLLYEILK